MNTRCQAKDKNTCRVHGFKEETGLVDYKDEYTVNLLRTLNADHDFADFFLNAEEKEVIHSYTGISHEPINKFLYDNEEFMRERLARVHTEEDKLNFERYLKLTRHRIQVLDRAFAKVVPIRERRVFRSVRLPGLDEDKQASFKQITEYLQTNFPVGKTVNFPAYLSTSIDASHMTTRIPEKEENSYFVLDITTKQGIVPETTVIDDRPGHIQEYEREVILPRNMTFKVISVDRKTRFLVNSAKSKNDEKRKYMNCYTIKLEEVKNGK